MESARLGHESIKKEFMAKLRKQYIEELLAKNRRKLLSDSGDSSQSSLALSEEEPDAEDNSLELLRNRFLLAYQELHEEDIRKWLKKICRLATAEQVFSAGAFSFPNQREKRMIEELLQPQKLAKQTTIRTLTK